MRIILPGVPVAQARMKFTNRGGFGRVYDPKEREKKIIRREIEKIVLSQEEFKPFEHPTISFVFQMPILKSTAKKELPRHESGLLKHEKKPDIDNFIKLYLDCLDGIIFEGDQKVMLGSAFKLYHPEPKTIIVIEERLDILSPQELDRMAPACLSSIECDKPTSV